MQVHTIGTAADEVKIFIYLLLFVWSCLQSRKIGVYEPQQPWEVRVLEHVRPLLR